jgi:membrane associated rhomboid family serine protease
MSFEARDGSRESFGLRGDARAIVLDADGVHHPASPQGRGRSYTPYEEITHLAASNRNVWLGARRSVFLFTRRAFDDPNGPDALVRTLLARIARRPGGPEQLARMRAIERSGRTLSGLRATWVLAGVCLAVFALQLWLGEAVLEVGYFSPALVTDGDLWRIVTANLIHAFPRFPLHLVLNLAGLIVLGSFVERPLGVGRTICIMGASALAAMTASGLVGYVRVVGVSGVVFGLAGAVLWLELRHAEELPAWLRIPRRALIVLLLINAAIMALIPLIAGAAHVGGFAAGLATAAAVTRGGVQRRVDPLWIKGASALVVGVAALAVGTAAADLAGETSYRVRHSERLARLPGVSPFELNDRAWTIAIAEDSTREELEAALLLAERAVRDTRRKSPAVLDTLAEIHFLLGSPEQAIALIDEAIGWAPDVPYYREQRRRFTGERAADDRPQEPLLMPVPRSAPDPAVPRGDPGLTV